MSGEHVKPDQRATNDYYDSIAPGYDELHGEEQLKKYRLLAELCRLPQDARILDVGAGTGIGNQVFPGMIGVDPSAGLLARHPHAESVVAPAEQLPFPDKSFDAVLCVTAIHHADYQAAVAEMQRVSRGVIAITILKKSLQASAILQFLRGALDPALVLEEEKDWLVVHLPRNA